MANEKRTSERKRLSVAVSFKVPQAGKSGPSSFTVTTQDISGTGLSFESKELFPLGAELDALIQVPGRPKPIPCRMRIVRIESDLTEQRFNIGVTFTQIERPDQQFLSAALDRINLRFLLDEMLRLNATDMHLTVGHPPILRRNHELIPMDKAPTVEDGQVQAMIFPLMNDFRRRAFEKNLELDFAFSPGATQRFRINLHWQKERMEAAIRNVSSGAKSFEDLGLPVIAMERLCRETSGLVLITGKASSGKTTTLAAMIQYINAHFPKMIVTIEDPIEFVFTNEKGIVKQREIGRDTYSFATALKAVLRQDPDVIVVAELRDQESIQAALNAAETGHLVIATVHAGSAVQALEKIVGSFSADNAAGIAKKLASCLRGVLFQVLLPGLKGDLVMATELLLNNTAVANMISLANFNQLDGVIQTGVSQGMHTLESSVKLLKMRGSISPEVEPRLY